MSATAPALRVVSLVPSVTETLLAWGITPLACTRFCEQPQLPHVGGTKDPDISAIATLSPDLVVVCDEENRVEDADSLMALGIEVHSCSPRRVGEVGPDLVVVDSVQTLLDPQLASTPGSVAQVRDCSHRLVQEAKRRGCAMVLVGHVTKDGSIAGPRVLEHMVDVVMSFEGERSHQYRILRSLKNRFGPVDEIGVFAMAAVLLAVAAVGCLIVAGVVVFIKRRQQANDDSDDMTSHTRLKI